MTSSKVSPLRLPGGRVLALDQPRVMGILNVTPDSFSDGGVHDAPAAAVAHARVMLDEGADLIDIGGESTRPGAQRVPAAEQICRVVPVIREVVKLADQYHQGVVVSIDTTLSEVAQAAIDAGASILNDVSAGREDPGMLKLAAKLDLPIVLMHMQGSPATMQASPQYDDVVAQVKAHLLQQAQAAMDAGVKREQIVLDPGIGFGKTREHNLKLLAHLDELVATGFAVLLGTSRKRFMGSICRSTWRKTDEQPPVASPASLVGATCATTAWGVSQGVHLFRVHDVKPNRQAADVAHAMKQARG